MIKALYDLSHPCLLAVMKNWDGWWKDKFRKFFLITAILYAKDWILSYPFPLHFFCVRIQSSLKQMEVSNDIDKAKEKNQFKTFCGTPLMEEMGMIIVFRELTIYSYICLIDWIFHLKPAGIIWVNNIEISNIFFLKENVLILKLLYLIRKKENFLYSFTVVLKIVFLCCLFIIK